MKGLLSLVGALAEEDMADEEDEGAGDELTAQQEWVLSDEFFAPKPPPLTDEELAKLGNSPYASNVMRTDADYFDVPDSGNTNDGWP